MAQIHCVVERITYQNPENGYSVFRVKVKGYDDLVTLVVLMNYIDGEMECDYDVISVNCFTPVLHIVMSNIGICKLKI